MFVSRVTSILLAALACFASAPSNAQSQVVRYQEYPGSFLHLLNWVMKDKGFCARQGLDCQTVLLASGPLGQQAAAAGSVDLIVSSMDVMLQAVAKGNDLQAVGSMVKNNIYSMSAGAHVQQPNRAAGYPANMKDFAGKRIGVTARGSASEMYARALLAGARVPLEDVTFVPVGSPTTAFAALGAKQVDAVVNFDPVPALCEATKMCNVVVDLRKGEGPADVQAMNGGFVVWQARREYVEKNAATIDKFLKAQAEALAWMRDAKNHGELVGIAKARYKLGDDVPAREQVLLQMVADSLPQYGLTLDRKVVDGFNQFLQSNNFIQKPLDPAVVVYKNAP